MGKVTLDGFEDIPVPCPFCGEYDDMMPVDTDASLCQNCEKIVFDDVLKKHASKMGILKKGTLKYKLKYWIRNLLEKAARRTTYEL